MESRTTPVTAPDDLEAELRRAADAEYLLVVSDFDGVLAPFVDDPTHAAAEPEAMGALDSLAALPRTTVALVSGRGRADLAARSDASAAVELVGSHGAEWESGFATEMGDDERARLAEVVGGLEGLASGVPGAFVETKQASAALHYRTVAEPPERERLRTAALEGPGALPGVHVTAGKNVVEVAVVETDKGTAISTLRERMGPGADPVTVFCGDDVTDERGFAVLGPHDLGVKVGEGETAARLRVAGIPDVTALYARLAELRGEGVGPHRR